MAYNDGLITLFAFGGIYAAKVFSFNQFEIILFAIGLNISAGIGAVIGYSLGTAFPLFAIIFIGKIFRNSWNFWKYKGY